MMSVRSILIGVVGGMTALTGCSVTRPPQVNLILNLDRHDDLSIDSFIEEVSRRLSMKFSASDSNIPNANPSRQFEIYSDSVSIFVISVPDNKCIPIGTAHITYKERNYRIDILPKRNIQSGNIKTIEAAFKAVGASRNATVNVMTDKC